ncbi:MAG: hypothetical protein E6R08_08705 [Nevskiaceae bacterium]|nr:MAG: hypothetical protein E6R08_08705 [Nevskiaceae bacterium]
MTTNEAPAPRPKSNVAQIVSAAVAIVALAGIYVQVDLTRVNAQRASARQVYLAYSQATLQYPRLARPNYPLLKANPDPTELVRYQIYVANMLTAYDEIFQIIDDKEWVASFEYDVEDHLPYLCEQNDRKYFASFTPKTQRLVAARKKAHCGNLAPILKNAPTYP